MDATSLHSEKDETQNCSCVLCMTLTYAKRSISLGSVAPITKNPPAHSAKCRRRSMHAQTRVHVRKSEQLAQVGLGGMAGIINSLLGASLLLVISCLEVFVFRFHHYAAKIFRAPAFGEVKIEVDGCLAQESPTLPGFSRE